MVSNKTNVRLGTFLCLIGGSHVRKNAREIANDSLTPKKSDKQSSSDFFERLREEDEDGLDYEIESYEVIAEYR